jgi:hypothetical protein
MEKSPGIPNIKDLRKPNNIVSVRQGCQKIVAFDLLFLNFTGHEFSSPDRKPPDPKNEAPHYVGLYNYPTTSYLTLFTKVNCQYK